VHQAPLAEGVEDGLPRREVVGQKASGTTAPQNVEDGVQNLAQWPEVRPTPTAPVVEEGFDECRLFIGEVAGVDVAALL
jgi:hypothetical protein